MLLFGAKRCPPAGWTNPRSTFAEPPLILQQRVENDGYPSTPIVIIEHVAMPIAVLQDRR